MGKRRRLDVELVARGLEPSRAAAQRDIAAGLVTVGGAPALSASRLVAADEPLVVRGSGRRYVSRGGLKLDAALARFGVDPSGRRALDAGASTGGFVDCLLAHGASSVVAVDVGRGQLDPRLRADPRVEVRERTDVRSLTLETLGGSPVSLVVADLAFISLRLAVPVLAGSIAAGGADLLLLVKPQFEAGRRAASAGKGVIRDPETWREAVEAVGSALVAAGAAIMGCMPSPIRGAQGNVEFFLHAKAHALRDAPRGLPGPTGARVQAGLERLRCLAAEAVAEALGSAAAGRGS